MQATQTIQEPQSQNSVYVGTYGKYNAGSLVGFWADLEDYADYDDFLKDCLEFHSDEADPELMFQAWQCELSGDYITECHIDPDLWDFLDLEDCQKEIVIIYSEIADGDLSLEDLIEQATERYAGCHTNHEEFVIDHLENMGFDFDALYRCGVSIDYEGTWRTLRHDYDFVRIGLTNHYFRSH